jgi:hypothetical protein
MANRNGPEKPPTMVQRLQKQWRQGIRLTTKTRAASSSNRPILLMVLFITIRIILSDFHHLFLATTTTTNHHHYRLQQDKGYEQQQHDDQQQQQWVPPCDVVFSGLPIANRTFSQVRKTYNVEKEATLPMAVVPLPYDFQGRYRPPNVLEFQELAHTLLDPIMGNPVRNSTFAIVLVCLGMDICPVSQTNRQHYASLHGYDILALTTTTNGGGGRVLLDGAIPPKMLKFLLLAWALDRGYDWLFLMDADALITNSSITLTSLLDDFQPSPQTSLIATRGGQWKTAHALNNGIFFLKTSAWSLQHLYEIFTSKWSFTRFLGKTLMDQPIQMSLLLARKELTWPPVSEEERGPHVLIVRKTKLNSFRRNEEYSTKDVSEGGQWKRGDFIAHFASGNKYSLMLDLMQDEGLPGIPPLEQRYPFSIPLPGHDTPAGTCWCDTHGRLNCVPKYHVIGVHKAGTKALLKYLSYNPGLARTPYMEDPTRWLTDAPSSTHVVQCQKKRQQMIEERYSHHGYNNKNDDLYLPEPVVLGKKATTNNRKTQHIATCSFQDYSLLYGQYSSPVNGSETCSSVLASTLPSWSGSSLSTTDNTTTDLLLDRPKYDEMVIWEKTFHTIRGTPLPELFRLMQPSANLLVTVRSPVSVTYSAYHHFGVFEEGIVKGPEHFHDLMQTLTTAWTLKDCTASNFLTCLPRDLVKAGSWLSRGMYSKYLPPWLEQFGCSQLHVFDVSDDPFREVKRLYDFLGVPNDDIARTATADTIQILHPTVPAQETVEAEASSVAANSSTTTEERYNNFLNKGTYPPMWNRTRDHLEAFFDPFYKELCNLQLQYPCLDVPLFRRHCAPVPAPAPTSPLQGGRRRYILDGGTPVR